MGITLLGGNSRNNCQGSKHSGSSANRYDPYDLERLKRDDPGTYRKIRDEAENRYK